jgi:hypothetical protein
MRNLQNPKAIYLKGFLFLIIGFLAAGLLILDHPSWKFVGLLAVAIWAFARFYYFAFYVIEHYTDPNFKFAGLWSFARYILKRRRSRLDQ